MTGISTPATSTLIDPTRLQDLLGAARGRFDVDALAACESTSTLLLTRAEQGAPTGAVIVADRQTAGRGSRGRRWVASPEASLTFSLLWRFAGGVERLSGLSLAVGVAVVRALASLGATGVTLKWPNDILYRDAKLGGILVELQEMRQEMRQGTRKNSLAVIGIGLNLQIPDAVLAGEALALPPAALAELLAPLPERDVLLARLLGELASVLDRFSAGGFVALREQWLGHHAWQDRPVQVLRDGRVSYEGICRGADADGALLVETATGSQRCLSGDVSLRAR
ncbi:MAG: biotin--[acetyl-CoA-carboxylase] ligase [Propionivibrio sp.]